MPRNNQIGSASVRRLFASVDALPPGPRGALLDGPLLTDAGRKVQRDLTEWATRGVFPPVRRDAASTDEWALYLAALLDLRRSGWGLSRGILHLLSMGQDCPTSAVRYALQREFRFEMHDEGHGGPTGNPPLVVDFNPTTSLALDQIGTVDALREALVPELSRAMRDSDARAHLLRALRDANRAGTFDDIAADDSEDAALSELLGRLVQPHLAPSGDGDWAPQTSWSGPDFSQSAALSRYNLEGVERPEELQRSAARRTLAQLPDYVPALELLWTDPASTKPYVATIREAFNEFIRPQGDDEHAWDIHADETVLIGSALAAINARKSGQPEGD